MNQASNQDDLDDGDVMAASASLAVNDNKKKDPDEDEDGDGEAEKKKKEEPKPDAIQDASTAEDLNLGTSGGLMDALMDRDPAAEFSEEHLAQVEADKKQSKKEIQKRLAAAKKREQKKAAEKKKKEAEKKKKAAAAAKKKKEKKEKEEKIAAERLKKEEAMLKSFMADDELPKVPDPNDSYLDQGLKKTNALSELADEQIAEQNLADSAKSIVKSAKETMFKGMASGFSFFG